MMAFKVTDEMLVAACRAFVGKWGNVLLFEEASLKTDMRAAIEAIAPMIHNNALEVLAARAEEMINGEDTNTSDRQALLRAFHRQDMAYEIAEAARAMKTTQSA